MGRLSCGNQQQLIRGDLALVVQLVDGENALPGGPVLLGDGPQGFAGGHLAQDEGGGGGPVPVLLLGLAAADADVTAAAGGGHGALDGEAQLDALGHDVGDHVPVTDVLGLELLAARRQVGGAGDGELPAHAAQHVVLI